MDSVTIAVLVLGLAFVACLAWLTVRVVRPTSEQQERSARRQAKQAALDHDARWWRALMDPRRHAVTPAEALRCTARGAVEDWMEREQRRV